MAAIYLIIEPVPAFQSFDNRTIRPKVSDLIELSEREGEILVKYGKAIFIKPADPPRKRRRIS